MTPPAPERAIPLAASRRPDSQRPSSGGQVPLAEIPIPPTRLVGREGELAALTALLEGGDARLVTLTGPGGVGKTRLALQLAAEARERYGDGTYFVPLAAISDPDLVASTIARAVGIAERADQSLTEALIARLRGGRVLLVLDNFEHLLPAGPLLAALLAACPGLQLLVTSRVALRLAAERRHPVPPLAFPDPEGARDAAALTRYGAVALFVARAQAIRPDFRLADQEAGVVANICARLDGLPLAIELAATRVDVLSPTALLRRLDRRLALLTGGARDQPARQQTLRGALDWSHNLLGAGEQRLLRRLAVFAGGFTLEAVAAICLGPTTGPSEDTPTALEGVTPLVNASLLHRLDDVEGEPRFGMLETIREYAAEQLASSGEADTIRRAHAEYFLTLAERAEPELWGPRVGEWLARLEREHDNLRAALGWLLEPEEGGLALRLAAALWRFWSLRGDLSEGRRRLEAVLAATGKGPLPPGTDAPGPYPCGSRRPATLRAGLLFGAAFLQFDPEGARPLYEASLARFRELGDRRGIAACLGSLGHAAIQQGDLGRAERLLAESLALCRELGDARGAAFALRQLGWVALERSDHARAVALHEESLALYRGLGDRVATAIALQAVGELALAVGDYPRARSLGDEGLALRREHGVARGTAASLHALGVAALAAGEVAVARAHLEESLALCQGIDGNGARRIRALVTGDLGNVALEEGDPGQAWALFAESLALGREQDFRRVVAHGVEGLAAVAGACGQPTRAARLFGIAEGLRLASGLAPPPTVQARNELRLAAPRAQLGAAAWQTARAEGLAMPAERALAYVLSGEDSPGGEAAPAIQPRERAYPAGLSPREAEVLGLLAAGRSNREIAAVLYLSPRTVQRHVANLYLKIGAHNRAEATAYALRHKLA